MTSSKKSRSGASLIRMIPVVSLILFSSGCTVPLSKKTCGSLQGVSMQIMNDRQSGLSKEEAVAKLEIFTFGKPDSKPFYEVTSKIIEAAYKEPLGISDTEKAEITKSFVSRIDERCLSGELGPGYNPIIRTAPVIH